MANDPILAPLEAQHLVIAAQGPGAEMPAPPAENQKVADDLFAQAATALIGLQTGALAAGLVLDNAREEEEPDGKPSLRPVKEK
jgi:hypothetical protein